MGARTVAASAALLVTLAAGCGGPMRADELRRGIESLHSYAADGELLARSVAENRTRSTFARVHARDLAERADHEAEKLHDATAHGFVAVQKQKAVDVAGRISDALGEIELAPGNELSAGSTEIKLARLADQAERLAETL